MTLLFNSTKIDNPNSKLGCIQLSTQIEQYENINSFVSYCKDCNCPLFPTANDRSNQLDCPICHPNSDYSKKTFRFLQSQKPTLFQNHFFFVFDIAMPPKILFSYIKSLYESINNSDAVSIICITNNVIFASVINGLLVFDVFDNQNLVKSLDHYIIHKKDLNDVVLPSISSIYTLIPAELDLVSNPFASLECALKSVSTPNPDTDISYINTVKPKISFLVFLYRSIAPIQVANAESLGTSIFESNGAVHFGGPPEFRRFSAIAHYSFGSIFETTHHQTQLLEKVLTKDLNQNELIFNLLKDSYCQPSLIHRLVELSQMQSRMNLYAPRSVTFTKTTGCSGSVLTKEKAVMLDLNPIIGGSIQIEIDPSQLVNNQLRLLEYDICDPHATENDEKTINGHYMLTVHTLTKNNGEEDKDTATTLILKAFASDILRETWDGENLSKIIAERITPEIKQICSNTSLYGINLEEEQAILSNIVKANETSSIFTPPLLMQLKVLRLYYVLLNRGKCNIDIKQIERPDCDIIVAPPVLYVLKKNEGICKSIEEILSSTKWPYSVIFVDQADFLRLKSICVHLKV